MKSKFAGASPDGCQIPRLHTVMKFLMKTQGREIPDINVDGTATSDAAAKAEAFNEFFIRQSRKSVANAGDLQPINTTPDITSTLSGFQVSCEEAGKLLNSLDLSAGFKRLPTKLLKVASAELPPSIT